MKRITPVLAATTAALIAAPLAAIGADASGIVDQATAWVVVAFATAATSAIASVVARIVGVTLDARARETIQTALERAAALALEWVLDQAADTPIGKRIAAASRQMLPYVDHGATDSLRRFGLDAETIGPRQHLEDMAKAELIRQLTTLAPDRLTETLDKRGTPIAR